MKKQTGSWRKKIKGTVSELLLLLLLLLVVVLLLLLMLLLLLLLLLLLFLLLFFLLLLFLLLSLNKTVVVNWGKKMIRNTSVLVFCLQAL